MASNYPFFTVILSTYRESNLLLQRSISSILNQSFTDFELLIIKDDPDRSNNFVQKYLEDSRVKLIINKKNIGLTNSLNKAIKISNGKYIVRQDADDYSHLDRLGNAYNFLKTNNEVKVYSTPYIIKDKILPRSIKWLNFNQNRLRYKNNLAHGSLIIDRDLISKIEYNPKFRFAQDFDLYNRLLDKGHKIEYDINNITYVIETGINRVSEKYSHEQQYFNNLILKRNGFGFMTLKLARILRLDIFLDIFYEFKRN